jgi:hypothetical protein
MQVYLNGEQIASSVFVNGRYRVIVPLPPNMSQATVVVVANFMMGGMAQARLHKTIAVVRAGQTQQADIDPMTTLAAVALETSTNTVAADLDISAFAQLHQILQGHVNPMQVDFSSNASIQAALPVMLVVTTNPSGAQVFLNDQSQGTTPIIIRTGLQGGSSVTLAVRHQGTVGDQNITTTLSRTVTLKVRGSTPVHFNFTPQIVSHQVSDGILTLWVRNAGSVGEKVVVRFGDTQAVVGTIADVDADGVATVTVAIPSGLSGQVAVRVQNAVRISAPVTVALP